jgi:hypothetical protein
MAKRVVRAVPAVFVPCAITAEPAAGQIGGVPYSTVTVLARFRG